MELWKLGNSAYIIPATGMVNKLRFLYSSFVPQNSPQDSNREMTEKKKKRVVQIFGTPCHLFMTDSSSIMTYLHTCIRHLMPSLFHLMGVALYCNFFFLPSVFLLQLVFYLIKICCLSPLSVWAPTARPFIFKCLLNNVGLVKAQSSFFLALSRYVLIIKHVSVSTRLLPAFVKDFIKPAVLICGGALLPPCGVRGNYTPAAQTSKATEFFILNT